jgi:hypothetical protein
LRPRSVVLASVVAALGFAALPAMAVAAPHPHHNHGVTIAATPNPIVAGDAVLIYGQLNTTNPGGQTIVLYHRINPAPFFSVVGTTKTDATGFYEFNRPQNPVTDLSVVQTNRSWFVRAPGLPGNIHSRTVHERVAAEVTLTAPAPTAPATAFLTRQQVVFTGTVIPNHAGDRVRLQEQNGLTGNTWKTVKVGRLDGSSSFSIPYRFQIPGDHAMRILLPADARNIASPSNSVTVVVQQKEHADFTINTSAPIIIDGGSATITGVLTKPASMSPDPSVMVTLWGHTSAAPYAPITSTTTGTDGSYSFSVSPQHNEVYQVRTSFAPLRASAQLFEGVQDAVTITPSATTSAVGSSVTFSGSVTPDKAGHVIDLERLGADGHYHIVAVGVVNASSTYQFNWTFGTPGTKTFLVHVPGGPDNVGADSSTVAVTVSLPPVASLPPAS